jgi:2-oxoisovalerate ferredoxin oxidoreductase beta subunit
VSTFYERFERHDRGEGLKGRCTHYCAGCGHGLAHRYLSDAIEKLGIQDRTVAISPVGCGVFLHWYLDVGHSQASHGRASAVALGHKLANPSSVVVSYQGDGDLASIGLLEIMQAAQLGIPITVVYVNNAVYGMTGGQLAPTTLMGQKTTTSPRGRDRTMGHPLKMAEIIAGLDAPVFVERVALFDAKQRTRAARAIEKALRTQVEDRGFSFVEVLAECPTHLKTTPAEAERWVKEQMLPVFPLGVKKDVAGESWAPWSKPTFDPAAVLEAIGIRADAPARSEATRRTVLGRDVGLKFAGAGGDGAQTAAMLVARAGIAEGLDATHIPSYGPESRGGTSYADVRLADGQVLSPDVPEPDVLVAFNAPSLAKFGPTVAPGGTVVYDSAAIPAPPPLGAARVVAVPCSAIAAELGQPLVKNVVALGALHAATSLLPAEALLAGMRDALKGKRALVEINEEAFRRGQRSVASAG